MIKSMTGFGRYEMMSEDNRFTVEMKGVNHRYLEASIKLPRRFSVYEAALRTELKKYVTRGKIDIFINYESLSDKREKVIYNHSVAMDYYDNLKKISEEFDIELNIDAFRLARFPDVMTVEEENGDDEALWELLRETFDKACINFVDARAAEGENLKRDILDKLDKLSDGVASIDKRYPQVVEEYRERLYSKVKDILGNTNIDQGILATEITLFADKICVDEETVRLKSHINAMVKALSNGDDVGRKLDFIAQEMNREANTILSKSNDMDVTNNAIDLKTEIEKIREQIQNIE